MGYLAVDDLLYIDRYPPADHKALVQRRARRLGGLAGTALAAAAGLGARCGYAGVLGRDELSAVVRAGLAAADIDLSRLIEHEDARPCHSIIVVGVEESTRNIFCDVNRVQPYPQDAVTRDLIASARVLFIDQMGPATHARAAGLARELRIPVVADIERDNGELTRRLMASIDHLIVPRHFAAEMTGRVDPRDAVCRLHEENPRTCTAVTCGRDGCHFIAGENGTIAHQPAFEVISLDTTGCGDVFHGAYAAALADGCDVQGCIVQASAAAAIYASREAGWEQLPRRNEVEAFLQKRGSSRPNSSPHR